MNDLPTSIQPAAKRLNSAFAVVWADTADAESAAQRRIDEFARLNAPPTLTDSMRDRIHGVSLCRIEAGNDHLEILLWPSPFAAHVVSQSRGADRLAKAVFDCLGYDCVDDDVEWA